MNKTAGVLIALLVLGSPTFLPAEGSAEAGINRIDLDFRGNAALIINTSGKSTGFTFVFADDALPDANNEWRFRRLKPYLFHIKHRNWQHHYQINTGRGEVYRVTGGKFGKMGGSLQTMAEISVDTAGSGREGTPGLIYLHFAHAGISYRGDTGRCLVYFFYTVDGALRQEFVLHETTEWSVCAQSPQLYHLMVPGWVDHWMIDTNAGQLYRVIGSEFCRPAARRLPLAALVRVFN